MKNDKISSRKEIKIMNYEEKILKLFKNSYLETSTVVKNNIPKIYLTKLLNENKIERIGRGIYIKKDDMIDEFTILQAKSKNAIFSNMTALYLHGLSNRIPINYDITVPFSYNGSLQKQNNVNLYYCKRELLELGMIKYQLESGNDIIVYDIERTICDIIKNKNKLDSELFNKAIREYFYSNNKDNLKLYQYAKALKIEKKVNNTFEVLK